jgi:broad specificity phosphatase PhoE
VEGEHTGLTDLPLTERGELNAQSLGSRLPGFTFAKVFTSPLKRAVLLDFDLDNLLTGRSRREAVRR